MKRQEGIFETVSSFTNFHCKRNTLRLIFYSMVTGALTGAIVSAYTYFLNNVPNFRQNIFNHFPGYKYMFVIFLFILSACIIQITLNKYPLISGSGIPQVMGLIQKKFKFNWFPEIITKFFSGLLAIFIGFSLGREGPSIHLGALLGDGVNKITRRSEVERKYLLTAGASAGLSAAFNAPLAGAIFAIEELHKFFSPILLICVLTASLASNAVAKLFLGTSLAFHNFTFVSPINFELKEIIIHIILITILSVILVILATLFNYSIIKFKTVYSNIKLSKFTTISIVSLIGLLAINFLPEITGGGHQLVENLLEPNFSLRLIGLILVLKFIFTMLSYATGAPGGIFLPLLVLAALVGKMYGVLLSTTFHFSNEYITLFVLIAMTSFFTAVVRTPVTGVILILEMSGNFSNLFSLVIASTITYALSELLHHSSVYEQLYENMLGKKGMEKPINDTMVTLKMPVVADSQLSNKMIKDIKWPENLLIVGIERAGKLQFIPNGNTLIQNSDILIFLTDENTSENYADELLKMSSSYDIRR